MRRGPTGLLRERASGVISRARAEYEARRTAADRLAETNKAIKLAIDESLSKGITTFQDAGSPFATVDILKKMADAHELRMRIWMMLRAPNEQLAANLDQLQDHRRGRRFLHRARHQARDRWRAGLARRMAAGALHG